VVVMVVEVVKVYLMVMREKNLRATYEKAKRHSPSQRHFFE